MAEFYELIGGRLMRGEISAGPDLYYDFFEVPMPDGTTARQRILIPILPLDPEPQAEAAPVSEAPTHAP